MNVGSAQLSSRWKWERAVSQLATAKYSTDLSGPSATDSDELLHSVLNGLDLGAKSKRADDLGDETRRETVV